jgi:hypothetical protein
MVLSVTHTGRNAPEPPLLYENTLTTGTAIHSVALTWNLRQIATITVMKNKTAREQ